MLGIVSLFASPPPPPLGSSHWAIPGTQTDSGVSTRHSCSRYPNRLRRFYWDTPARKRAKALSKNGQQTKWSKRSSFLCQAIQQQITRPHSVHWWLSHQSKAILCDMHSLMPVDTTFHVFIYEWLFTIMFVCCCCNLMFYDWSEYVMSVFGTTKHSSCNCVRHLAIKLCCIILYCKTSQGGPGFHCQARCDHHPWRQCIW